MSGFALADARSIGCKTTWSNIFDLDADDVTSSQFAVDCNVEHRRVPRPAVQLEFGAD
jgi:hypothetical protein